MKIVNRSSITLLLIAALALPVGVSCEREEGPLEEAGESLDVMVEDLQDEGKDLGDKLEEAGESLGDKLDEARDELEEGAEEVKEELDGDGGS